MIISTIIIVAVGFTFRLWAARNKLIQSIVNQNEVVSPLTSWKRVTEGLYLHRQGISPYDGDVYHQTPLMLNFLHVLESSWNNVLSGMFVIFDMVAAALIGYAAYEIGQFLILLEQKSKPHYNKDCNKDLLYSNKTFKSVAAYAMAWYIFNPYAVAACSAKSTAVFDNILIALLIILTLKGWRVLATFVLALATYQNLYPIILVLPVSMCLVQREFLGVIKYSQRPVVRFMLVTAGLTLAWLSALLLYTQYVTGSSAFLRSTYGFILTAPELTPNMGIFWYFFTEMFQHFHVFFMIVFQVNIFVYTIPLSIRLRQHPAFLLYVLLVIISIFKSYPSYADVGFYLSFVPCWSFSRKYTRNMFIVTNIFIWCAILSPIFYHLWIYTGSANANFYFALSLVYIVGQIFYITDVMYGYLRRDFEMYRPKRPADQPLEDDKVILK